MRVERITQASLLVLAFLGGFQAVAAPRAAAGACPTRSRQEWQRYLTEQADKYPNIDYRLVHQNMVACAETFRRQNLQSCFDNLAGFAKAKHYGGTNGMGMLSTNEAYLNAQPANMMDLPEEFRDGLPQNWEQIAKRKGWRYFRYSSRTVPNPPHGTFTRLLFLIQEPTHDRWIQFTYPNATPSQNEKLIDFITVQKKDGARTLYPMKLHFRQYWRDDRGRNPQLKVDSGDSCYSCHPGGMRRISPVPGSLAAIDFVSGDPESRIGGRDRLPFYRLNEFNDIMRGYGQLDFANGIVPKYHGPAMGKYTATVSGREVTANCAACHDGNSRGTINTSTAPNHVQHKLATDLTMPPNPEVVPHLEKLLVGQSISSVGNTQIQRTTADNNAVWAQIKAKYANEVKAWLKARSCLSVAENNSEKIKPDSMDRAIASEEIFPAHAKRKFDPSQNQGTREDFESRL